MWLLLTYMLNMCNCLFRCFEVQVHFFLFPLFSLRPDSLCFSYFISSSFLLDFLSFASLPPTINYQLSPLFFSKDNSSAFHFPHIFALLFPPRSHVSSLTFDLSSSPSAICRNVPPSCLVRVKNMHPELQMNHCSHWDINVSARLKKDVRTLVK